MDKATEEIVIGEVERKIKALNFINSVRKEIAKHNWTPLGDCPLCGKIPTTYILDCYKENKNGNKCNISGGKCRKWSSSRR